MAYLVMFRGATMLELVSRLVRSLSSVLVDLASRSM